jgi:hypothetical protein
VNRSWPTPSPPFHGRAISSIGLNEVASGSRWLAAAHPIIHETCTHLDARRQPTPGSVCHRGEGVTITATAGTIPCATIPSLGVALIQLALRRNGRTRRRHEKILQLNQ